MSGRYPGPPPDYPPGYVNPDYARGYAGTTQSNLPPSIDPNLGWYMDPSHPNTEYAANPHTQGGHGSQSPSGFAGEKRRNKLGYHRTSVACNHCRRRKIRCIPSQSDIHGRCTNCIRLKKECSFIPTEQQANELQSQSINQNSDSGLASNTSSPGPPGVERNPGYPNHAQPAFNQEVSPWPQHATAPPDDHNPIIGRSGVQANGHYDFGDQTARGYPPTSQSTPVYLGAPSAGEQHWRRHHPSPNTNGLGSGSSYVPGAGARQEGAWRGSLPPTPATAGSPRRPGNTQMPSVLNSVPSSSPSFAGASIPSMGAPIHGVPLPYSSAHPRQVPSQSLKSSHRQGSSSGTQSGYTSWMYPQRGPGHEMPGNGHSEN